MSMAGASEGQPRGSGMCLKPCRKGAPAAFPVLSHVAVICRSHVLMLDMLKDGSACRDSSLEFCIRDSAATQAMSVGCFRSWLTTL